MASFGALESLVAEAEGSASPAAIEILRGEPDPLEALLALAKSDNIDVRGWVVVAAQEVLGVGATSLLTAMLDDPNPDIRVLAMSSLEEVDPSAIPRLSGRLRRRLRSSNDYEVLATSWTLRN